MSEPRSALRIALPWILATLAIAALVAGLFALRDLTPPLDPAELERRHAAWRADPILDYDLVVVVEKDRLPEERYEVSVRDARVTREVLNGRPTRRGETGSPFSIDGLFDTIEETASGDIDEHTTLLLSFHPERNFPVLFKLLATDTRRRSFTIEVDSLRTADGTTIYSSR